ncbi:TTC28, partial [Acrasis kona]
VTYRSRCSDLDVKASYIATSDIEEESIRYDHMLAGNELTCITKELDQAIKDDINELKHMAEEVLMDLKTEYNDYIASAPRVALPPRCAFAEVYTILGSYLLKRNQKKDAIKYYQKACDFTHQHKYRTGYLKSLTNLAIVYESLECYKESVTIWERKMRVLAETRNMDADIEVQVATVCERIGKCHLSFGQVNSALSYYLKSMDDTVVLTSRFLQMQPSPEQAEFIQNLRDRQRRLCMIMSDLFREQGMYTDAIKHLEKHLELARKHDDVEVQANAFKSLGEVYLEMSQLENIDENESKEKYGRFLYYKKMSEMVYKIKN